MMRILIPNVTTPRNIGDLAMLEVLLDLVAEAHPEANVTVHMSEPELGMLPANIKVRTNIYSWIMFPQTGLISRLFKILYTTYVYFIWRLCGLSPRSSYWKEVLNDYQTADLIIFTGGGYLRSQVGVRQAVSLMSLVTVYLFAYATKAKIVVMPISFGPFAYVWQMRLFARLLSFADTVYAREKISYDLMQKYGVSQVQLSTDMVLLPRANMPKTNESPLIIGFTIMRWFGNKRQQILEDVVVDGLSRFNNHSGIKFQPIVQVYAPALGAHDFEVAERIGLRLKNFGCDVLPVQVVRDTRMARSIYGSLTVLLGMRMHSNILAALSGVPFVALAYEHKTKGIMSTLGLEEFCLDSATVSAEEIYLSLSKVLERRGVLSSHIYSRLNIIKMQEVPKLITALQISNDRP